MSLRIIDFNLTFQHEASGVKGQRIGYVRVSTFDQNVDRCPSSKHLAQIWCGDNGEQASSGFGF
ncbi:hypothetical protein CA227_23000 [Sphingomonas koreensis]|nr:hypothetical protein CA227_23000 [Sphingomonas koreensis]